MSCEYDEIALTGDQVEPRRDFIQKVAPDLRNLDVYREPNLAAGLARHYALSMLDFPFILGSLL